MISPFHLKIVFSLVRSDSFNFNELESNVCVFKFHFTVCCCVEGCASSWRAGEMEKVTVKYYSQCPAFLNGDILKSTNYIHFFPNISEKNGLCVGKDLDLAWSSFLVLTGVHHRRKKEGPSLDSSFGGGPEIYKWWQDARSWALPCPLPKEEGFYDLIFPLGSNFFQT